MHMCDRWCLAAMARGAPGTSLSCHPTGAATPEAAAAASMAQARHQGRGCCRRRPLAAQPWPSGTSARTSGRRMATPNVLWMISAWMWPPARSPLCWVGSPPYPYKHCKWHPIPAKPASCLQESHLVLKRAHSESAGVSGLG